MDRFPVDPTLMVTTRPRGGDWLSDDLAGLRQAGVDVLVSCLTPSEERELDLTAEASSASDAGFRFVRIPIDDLGVPAEATAFDAVIAHLFDERGTGASIAVHCRQGIGRSPLVVASLLVRAGESPARAWAKIADARGRPVPDTETQRAWLDAAAQRWHR